jgi:predicted cobalt transporter CbtA
LRPRFKVNVIRIGRPHMTTKPTIPPVPPKTWKALLVGTPLGWVVTLALAALGIYLFMSHTGHVVAALPYLVLLACPLMHLFMHGGHGHHHGRRE